MWTVTEFLSTLPVPKYINNANLHYVKSVYWILVKNNQLRTTHWRQSRKTAIYNLISIAQSCTWSVASRVSPMEHHSTRNAHNITSHILFFKTTTVSPFQHFTISTKSRLYKYDNVKESQRNAFGISVCMSFVDIPLPVSAKPNLSGDCFPPQPKFFG